MCLRASPTWSVLHCIPYPASGHSKAGSPCSAIMILAAVHKSVEEGREVSKVTKYKLQLIDMAHAERKEKKSQSVLGKYDRRLLRRQPKSIMALTPANYVWGY